MTVRVCKAILVLGLALAAGLATFNTVVVPGPVAAYIDAMMSMDALAPDATESWRVLSDPRVTEAAYWAVVAGKGLTALLLFVGALRLLSNRRGLVDEFQAAKSTAMLGATIGLLTWIVAVILVSAGWFLVPAAVLIDAQAPSTAFVVILLLVMVLVQQPDTELEDNKKPRRRPLN